MNFPFSDYNVETVNKLKEKGFDATAIAKMTGLRPVEVQSIIARANAQPQRPREQKKEGNP